MMREIRPSTPPAVLSWATATRRGNAATAYARAAVIDSQCLREISMWRLHFPRTNRGFEK